MHRKPEIVDASIVTLGTFAPSMFTPDWLEENELIGSEDCAAIKESSTLVISQSLTVLESESFRLEILANRLAITSKDVVTPALRDLIAGLLFLVPKSPVSAVGINCSGHYKLERTDDYHKIGDIFAPKDIWNKVFTERPSSAGLLDLTIGIFPFGREDTPTTGDVKKVSLQPSTKVTPNGVFLNLNNHRVIVREKKKSTGEAELAAQLIQKEWQSTMDESWDVFDKLISAALMTR